MRNVKGFTLFELLIAIVIICILGGILLDKITENKSKLKQSMADVKEIVGVSTDNQQPTKQDPSYSQSSVGCENGKSFIYIGKEKYYLGVDDGWGDLKPVSCGGK